jgi:hypothetical protein
MLSNQLSSQQKDNLALYSCNVTSFWWTMGRRSKIFKTESQAGITRVHFNSRRTKHSAQTN